MVDRSGELDQVFAALSDRTRRAMIVRLARQPATISKLGRPVDASKQAVSKHVEVLERAGLVRKKRQGREVECHLVFQPLTRAMAWLNKQVWSRNLERLGQVAKRGSR